MAKFNDRLIGLRREENLTQDELAKKLKITRSRLSMYESGKREPNFEMQELIADYFNIDLDYLMGRTSLKRQIIIDENGQCYRHESLIEKRTNPDTADALELYYKYLAADKKTRKMIDILLNGDDDE